MGVEFCQKLFCIYEMIIWFLFFNLLMCYNALISRSWKILASLESIMILLMCCWIWFASLLLMIFASLVFLPGESQEWGNPGNRGAWWAAVYGAAQSWTRLKWLSSSNSSRASLVAQRLKRLPTMQETWVWSLGQEDPLEKEMATHPSILPWRIPWAEAPGGLQSTGS